MFCSWVPESDTFLVSTSSEQMRARRWRNTAILPRRCASPNPRQCQATIEIVLISLSCRDIKNKPFHREHASSLRRVIETRHTAVQHISTFTETDILGALSADCSLLSPRDIQTPRVFAWVPIEVQKEGPTQLGEAFAVWLVSRSKERHDRILSVQSPTVSRLDHWIGHIRIPLARCATLITLRPATRRSLITTRPAASNTWKA